MKLDRAVTLGAQGAWQEAQVRMNPGSRAEWFILLQDIHNKWFVLADNNDKPIATENLEALVEIMRSLGQKEFTVFL